MGDIIITETKEVRVNGMNEECLICKAPLEYLKESVEMKCAVCGKKEMSKTRCVNGHYVCNSCHINGIDAIIGLCLNEKSKDPVHIIRKLMSMDFCHMHGPEHHIMVAASLVTAYKNAGGDIDLEKALKEVMNRGKNVPGGICGFWGSCGAAVSSGIFISVVTGSTPLETDSFGLSNLMTSSSLEKIGTIGGPRCCKRNSYLSVLSAIDFTEKNLGVKMTKPDVRCTHQAMNNQCIGKRCPFNSGKNAGML